MEVYDFLPTYTEFDKDTQNIIESIVGRESSSTSLYHKKEFHDYKLEKIDDSLEIEARQVAVNRPR